MILNLKILKFKKNLVVSVQVERLNEMNFVGTTSISFWQKSGQNWPNGGHLKKNSIFKFKI